jgi:putative tryptophan/tyrosine transport system substrate-binding protein
MKRREFITLIGGAAASPLIARAQQPPKMKRLAMVSSSLRAVDLVASYHPFYRAFFDELSRLSFVEGKSLVVERYSAFGQFDRVAQLAGDVVNTHPDAIFSTDTILGLAVKAATTIPIVTLSGDPVVAGLVSNIARPGGNVTGAAVNAGFEIWGIEDWASQRGSPQTVQRLHHRANTKRLGWSLRRGNPSGGQIRQRCAE